jgi:hypothetical protein
VNATTNQAWIAGVTSAAEPAAPTDHRVRFAQNIFLTEVPGLAFGIVTLAYIVSSLFALA